MTLTKYNFPKLVVFLLATLTLASCGGGGGGGGGGGTTASTTATITSISPVGMVASGTPRALSITGTNFASGMTVTVSNSLGTFSVPDLGFMKPG